MASSYRFHGHAIVSDNDMIADADGKMPDALRNPADWARFQRALDEAAAVVLGRKGHLAHRNTHGRTRIVVSSSARGIEKRDDAWWWNPATVTLQNALETAVPGGGIIAIPGGRLVFDLFLDAGYDEFHLARARGIKIANGISLFSECEQGRSAEGVLSARGLTPAPTQMLDPNAKIELTNWRRAA